MMHKWAVGTEVVELTGKRNAMPTVGEDHKDPPELTSPEKKKKGVGNRAPMPTKEQYLEALQNIRKDMSQEPDPEDAILKTSALRSVAELGAMAILEQLHRAAQLEKTAKEKKDSYPAQVAKMAPAVVVKSLADLPKASIEKAIESRILKQPAKLKSIGKGAAGRYAGGVLGVGTAPLFFSGLKDLRDGTPEEGKKGAAKILAASSLYQYGKGAAEYGAQKGPKAVLKGGTSRMLVSLPGTALMVAGALKGAQSKDEKKKYLYGALGGAAGGLAKGGLEGGMLAPAGSSSKKVLHHMAAKGGGRAAAGVIGGVALTAIMDRLLGKKKNAGAKRDSAIWGASAAAPAAYLMKGPAKTKALAAGAAGLSAALAAYLTSGKGKSKLHNRLNPE